MTPDLINKALEVREHPYKELEDILAKHLEQTKKFNNLVKKCLKKVKKLKYKPGDVVFHPTHGNGIVVTPFIHDMIEIYKTNDFSRHYEIPKEMEGKDGYVVHFVKVEKSQEPFRSNSVNISRTFVLEKEIVPYTEHVKVLYG